jgi:hypothetical protein
MIERKRYMIKRNIFGVLALGLCLTVLPAEAVSAMEATKPAAAAEEVTPELKELYQRQSEIDKLLLEDNAKKIEKLGFMINSTGVVEDTIEIAISPFKEEYADFIYELVGKDKIKVIEMDQSILYSTSVTPDQISTDQAEEDKVYKEGTDAIADEELTAGSDISDTDEILEIQIESVDDVAVENDIAEEAQSVSENGEVRTTALETEQAKEQVSSMPSAAIAIAVGAALLASVFTLTVKRRRR